jgi:hypothetical protein
LAVVLVGGGITWLSDVPNPAPHVVWAAVVLTSMSHLSQLA